MLSNASLLTLYLELLELFEILIPLELLSLIAPL